MKLLFSIFFYCSVVDATRRDYFQLLEQELHRATRSDK